jgi:hypothetical protein
MRKRSRSEAGRPAELQRYAHDEVTGKNVMRKSLTMLLLLVGLTPAFPAIAHHSAAMFDRSKTVTLEGVVKEYKYAAPHTWIHMVIQQGDAEVSWAVEGGAPLRMKAANLGPDVIKAGDKVTIRVHPLRDGRLGGSFIDIKLPNGEVIKPL